MILNAGYMECCGLVVHCKLQQFVVEGSASAFILTSGDEDDVPDLCRIQKSSNARALLSAWSATSEM